MSTRSLTMRLAALEARDLSATVGLLPFVVCIESVDRSALAASERIVTDRFRDTGKVVWARERVTTEAQDAGRVCPAGGFDEPILVAEHVHCYWRTKTGSCQLCADTPIAEPRIEFYPETDAVGVGGTAAVPLRPDVSSQGPKRYEPPSFQEESDGVPHAPMGSTVFRDVADRRKRIERRVR
jgi:hypothetical protein